MAKQIRAARHYQQRNDPLRRIADRVIPGIKSDLKDSLKGLSDLIPQGVNQYASAGDWNAVKNAIDWGHFREVLKAPFGQIGKAREAGAQHGAQKINAAFASAGRKVRFRKAYNPDEPRDERGRWTDGGGAADSWTEGIWAAEVDHLVAGAMEGIAGLDRAAAGSDLKRIHGFGTLVSQNLFTAERKLAGSTRQDPYLPHLRQAAEAGRRVAATETVDAARAAAKDLSQHVRDLARMRYVEVEKAYVRKDANDQYAFDLYSQEVQDALRAAQDDLIAELEIAARDAIDEIILSGARLGLGPDEIIGDIREMIGLTARQSQAAMNYRDMLESLDPGALQRQLRNFLEDDNVQAALDAGQPMDAAMVDKLTNDYIDNYIDYRAETIAQTEATRAVSLGLQDSYQQAIDRGVFPSEAVTQQWKVDLDEVTCPICLSIPDMNPDGVAIDEAFDSIDGPQDSPPVHPNCRCSIDIVTDLDMVSSDGVDAGEAA